ncbi:Choline transporter-like protein 2 [Mizuhopecten yessoensis]|uniref:Choline transporter-like protein n=1 Tax=Mizuhopecten yessoensis TaxID=6573 RepID=A0A210QBN1_MIZYE|nr:Choline transporter-like protein 2 [Mizuhopecten yessoensis]
MVYTSPAFLSGKPKQHDPNFKGPLKNRSCTDIICCLIFVIFLGVFALVSAYAFIQGNPLLLLYPVDSDGVMCGSGTNAGKDYLFYFDLIDCSKAGIAVFLLGCPSPQICVTTCPSYYYSVATDVSSSSDLKYCKESADMSKDVYQLISEDECPAYILASSPVIRRCVPTVLVNFINSIGDLDSNINSSVPTTLSSKDGTGLTASILSTALDVFGTFIKAKEYAEKIMSEVLRTWWVIVVFMIIVMLLSLLYIVLLRLLAGFMVWFTIFGMLGAFGYASVHLLMYYMDSSNDNVDMTIYLSVGTITYSKSKMYLTLGILTSIIFTIILVITIFLCQRISIAIGLIKEASRAIGKITSALAFPILIMVLQVVLVGYFIVFAAYLASTGRTTTSIVNSTSTWSNGQWNTAEIESQVSSFIGSTCSNGTTSNACDYLKNVEENFVMYAALFALFMFFWLLNFIIALGQLSLAGAFASYYWAFDKTKNVPTFPLAAAMWRAIRYHLGSLAFGSFILAVVAMIRVVLEYLDHKLGKSENIVAKFVVKCLKCCFWCLEKCLKFLTKNAYIQMAIHGKNFCFSAKDAFFAIMRNILRVAVVDKVSDFVLFVGKLIIIGLAEALAFYVFNYLADDLLTGYVTTTNTFIVSYLIILVCAFTISSCFFDVFSMALSTLFMCFLEDIEMNDGSIEKPYFMSKELMRVLGVKNVIIQDKQKKGAAPSENF